MPIQHPIITDPNYQPEQDGGVVHAEILLTTGEDVVAYTSAEDGALVFQIDSQPNARRIRIYLNEATLHDGDPEDEDDLLRRAALAYVHGDGDLPAAQMHQLADLLGAETHWNRP
jgi:hypothetical protein